MESYRRINAALSLYLRELKKVNIEEFKRETEEYNNIVKLFDGTTTNEELNVMLIETFERMGYSKPWQGDFNEHMSNRNATLVFE